MSSPAYLQEYVSGRSTGMLRSIYSKTKSWINFRGSLNVPFVLQ